MCTMNGVLFITSVKSAEIIRTWWETHMQIHLKHSRDAHKNHTHTHTFETPTVFHTNVVKAAL